MATFSPQEDIKNMNAYFREIVQEALQEKAGLSSDDGRKVDDAVPEGNSDPLRTFAEKWGLHQQAMDRLRELPVDKQDGLMAAFHPTGAVHDMNAVFITALQKWSPKACKFWAHGECVLGDSCKLLHSPEAFKPCVKWARERLRELPVSQQEFVMARFNPHVDPNVMSVSMLLLNYLNMNRCKGWTQGECKFGGTCKFLHTNLPDESADITNKRKYSTDPLDMFAEKWGMLPHTMDRLRELPVHLQDSLMASFVASNSTRNVDASFIKQMLAQSPKACTFWASGDCKLGESCQLLHSEKAFTPCENFAKGECKYGDYCRFGHAAGQKPAGQERDQDQEASGKRLA
eukprot:CAMPEP_0180794176 /NCGR_PEP_ID=MMETSP1038_2-20121128/55447_1 /TAXON_ID=632150 /ORGANISM="Azadinium spinosum, Strain 3D9" /LENGTH=344 /DNA_ID=CAMNT_0022832853 /DNA_START=159 /DNA_END=1190 /DNA_ORIENTATION=-